jgi:hypothetical protein
MGNKAVAVGIGVSLGVGVLIGVLLKGSAGAGDDEPIVVVGNSMHLLASSGEFTADTNGKRIVLTDTTNRHVTSVEMVYVDPATNLPAHRMVTFNSEKIDIKIEYDKSAPLHIRQTPKTKELTFTMDGGDTSSDTISSVGGKPNNVLEHLPHDGHMQTVRIKDDGGKSTFPCGADGKCIVTIHYLD